jgi:steroid 5-alpha reductase family enzyme
MIRPSPDRVGITMIAAIIFAIVLGLALSAVMAMAWRIALQTGRSGWIDAIWSFAVGGAGVAAALSPIDRDIVPGVRQLLVAAMVLLWSLRLGIHISIRTANGRDDPRYEQLRTEWGAGCRRRLFWFLQIQAAVALVLVLAIAVAAHRPAPGLSVSDGLGGLILAVALFGEGLADRQLSDFHKHRADRTGICSVGLWRFSRHPNYFFEWLAWVAYAVVAIDLGGHYPLGWLALAAPAMMYWLLVRVSGIPPLEAHMVRSRGASFRDYQEKVNAFWPGPSRLPSIH